jgi:phage recombination protein Bet
MNAVAKIQPTKLMLMDHMADKYSLNVEEFSRTVRATCGLSKAGPEEFAAFLIVAKEYDLNPLLREIYAFPKQGGGIVPIVSIDGWVNLVNSHPACDGFEFETGTDDKGELISITCRMHRKDRTHPVVVTEYYEECRRDTAPWKMKHRMLRHKAMIQAARYAFGFSGIYDEDEGAKIAEMKDAAPVTLRTPPKPPVPPMEQIEQQSTVVDAEVEEQDYNGDITDDGEILDDTSFFERLEEDLAVAQDEASIEEVWTEADPMARFEGDETNQSIATAIKKRALKRIGG